MVFSGRRVLRRDLEDGELVPRLRSRMEDGSPLITSIGANRACAGISTSEFAGELTPESR